MWDVHHHLLPVTRRQSGKRSRPCCSCCHEHGQLHRTVSQQDQILPVYVQTTSTVQCCAYVRRLSTQGNNKNRGRCRCDTHRPSHCDNRPEAAVAAAYETHIAWLTMRQPQHRVKHPCHLWHPHNIHSILPHTTVPENATPECTEAHLHGAFPLLHAPTLLCCEAKHCNDKGYKRTTTVAR